MIPFRFALIGFAAATILAGCASSPSVDPPAIPGNRGETTVYIVRHAERADATSDPELSPIGYARADSLAKELREAGVNVIITTQLRRTQLTARPLARMRGIRPEIVQAGGGRSTPEHVDSVAAAVRRHEGATILIVGHSNTIGHIATRLGGDRIGDLCDSEYSNLIILSIPRGRQAKVLVQRYGPQDPPIDESCRPVLRSRWSR